MREEKHQTKDKTMQKPYTVYDAETLAKLYMTEFGLIECGWTFEWNQRKVALGLCSYRKRTIELSMLYVQVVSNEQIEDTILHEIAHALTPGAQHGREWKRMCVKVGANPERCADVTIPFDEKHEIFDFKYTANCKSCGHQHGFSRLTKKWKSFYRPACATCCNKFNYGNYSTTYRMEYTTNR